MLKFRTQINKRNLLFCFGFIWYFERFLSFAYIGIPYGPKYLGFRIRLCQSCSLLILYLLRCLTLRKCLQNVIHARCPNPANSDLALQHHHPQYLIPCFIVIRFLMFTWVVLAVNFSIQGFQ